MHGEDREELNGLKENLKKLIMDKNSITLCVVTFMSKILSDISVSEIGNLVTIGVGLTTIVYNLYKIKHEKKK